MGLWDILKGGSNSLTNLKREVLKDTPERLNTLDDKMNLLNDKIDKILKEGTCKALPITTK
jgi:hypothetical protein